MYLLWPNVLAFGRKVTGAAVAFLQGLCKAPRLPVRRLVRQLFCERNVNSIHLDSCISLFSVRGSL